MTGDVTISNAGVTAIPAGKITNTYINAAAAIAFSKLASLTSGYMLVGSATNVPTAREITGDVTVSNTGVMSIPAGQITNTYINAAAAIDATKIANGSVTNTEFQTLSDISTASTIQTQLNTKAPSTVTVTTITSSGTTVLTTANYIVLCNTATGAQALTLPAASTMTGRILNIKKVNVENNNVTITVNNIVSETIDGNTSMTIDTQYDNITIVSDGTNNRWCIL